MNSLKNIIEKINSMFLEEARNSIRMLEDLAMMEKYISESYDQRILIELLQNADDAQSTCAKISTFNNFFVFANNGKCFDERDIISISRSGASEKKQGKDIGYRGIGFKSIVSISNEILVYSNKTFFEFSKKKTSKVLHVNEEKTPTVRVPFYVTEKEVDSEILKIINNLENDGFSTIFIFLNSKIDLLKSEIRNISNGVFLFLKNMVNIEVSEFLDKTNTININRLIDDNKKNVSITMDNVESRWLIVNNDISEVQLAFKYANNMIIPCDEDESVYHCYLPTLEKTPFPFIINAPFHTDPSKKHLINNNQNKEYIKQSAKIVVNELINILNGTSNNYGIFNIINIQNNFSIYTDLFFNFLDILVQDNILLKVNGQLVNVNEYPMLPNSFDNNEINIIMAFMYGKDSELNTEYFCDIERFFKRYSNKNISAFELLQLLTNTIFVSEIPENLYYKLLAYIIRQIRFEWQINDSIVKFDNILIKNSLIKISNCDVNQFTKVNDELKFLLGDSEISWFIDICGFKNELEKPLLNNNVDFKHDNDNIIQEKFLSKWRTAEQQCIEIEKNFGHNAKYVGSKNLGYDVESRDKNGNKRYVEVKLLSSKSAPFTMTNNEYSSAHLYGNSYYLCLIYANQSELEVVYVQNPVLSLKLEKRVKQWEWFCDNYSGEVFRIPIK